MADPQIVTTLQTKRDEIERLIASYEAAIIEARNQLAHVNATLHIFENKTAGNLPYHLGLGKLFKRGEMFGLCKDALAGAADGLDTRQLALHIIKSRGLDETDGVLRKKVAYHVIHIMRQQAKRRKIATAGKNKGIRIWRLP